MREAPAERYATDRPWLIVIEERARHLSRQRTGSDAFWRFYLADVTSVRQS